MPPSKELIGKGGNDAPWRYGSKFGELALGKVARMDGDEVEESGFTARIAETFQDRDIFRFDFHSEGFSERR
jgi:hypothetical protein